MNCLWEIIITPLELFYEAIFVFANKISHSELAAIILLSIVVSTLVLPLYMRAEKIEIEEQKKEKELSHWAAHIKKNFRGDERYMTLNAYYRENHYNPIYQLKSSISILLQIPFFLAAYHFLGNYASDEFLSNPDGILSIGSLSVNVLPILMTLINLIATFIYTKGFPVGKILRSLILPLVFLVLLYNSPCALVIYWTMNNIYSLIKIIIIKVISERKNNPDLHLDIKRRTGSGEFIDRINSFLDQKPQMVRFILPMMFMSVFTGLLIPLDYLSASPEEFINATNPQNPLLYLLSTVFVSIGFYTLWPAVFYFLANNRTKHIMAVLAIGGSVFSAVNYLFSADTGTINTVLVFDQAPGYTLLQKALNVCLLVLIVTACLFLYRFKKTLSVFFIAMILTTVSISVINAKKINDSYQSVISHIDDFREEKEPRISLSANGYNVMVIMLDRGSSELVPYVFNEFPEIKNKFDGFTYYPNSTSFGIKTLNASSALFGGYEYTPERMDERANESLKDKHDESLKVLPKLFSDQGYKTTLMDLPYPGWTQTGDYSAFSDIDNCETYHAVDYFNKDSEIYVNTETRRNRNLFLYSIFRCVPTCLKEIIYDNGYYLWSSKDAYDTLEILPNYKVLENLDDMTHIDNESDGCLFLINNETTHDVQRLRNFDPYEVVPSDEDFEGYYISDGDKEIYLETWLQTATYESTVAALRELGNYFDYLRSCGIYDNTRIIIVSDHGIDLDIHSELSLGDISAEYFNCMFFIKDFESSGHKTDYTFMTNADVPTVATKGIINNPVNPYTGKPINSDLKYSDLYIGYSITFDRRLWNPDVNKGNTFYYDKNFAWFKLVNENVLKKENWVQVDRPGD
jgi:membrane protein insertase Oxa1/YidC/SpoIIIJ